ncbi:RHS repeat-associated core domain [Alcanivorax xiamenensis]|uniref:RHS repeat-associated core domain n=1 Tax=Alcanivorax xiamenensis TaxID=1177156 RepID=A0ABQ6Y2D7_9GAMM|nr:VCBS repeat-containing protein [Alcanivorax xiamenensis]KAF0802140.1 RHS repeat-associated core domain [Alcanivorax xiamenensis]
MAARWLVAWVWGVVLLIGAVSAQAAPEPDLNRYEVYYGDMDSREYGLDGYSDLLLRARRDYTWISAGVSIPVPLPSNLPDLLFCGTASGEFMPCTLKDGAAIPAEPSDDFELIWSDGDGDGLPDLLVQAHDLNTRSLYLRSQKKRNLALMDQFIGLGGQRVSGMPDLGEEDENGTENSAAVMSLAATSNSASSQSLTGQLVGASPGALDVVQGQLRYSIPIQLPDGPGGINPSFSLDYSSDSGYGHAGMGFHISGLSAIERCPMRRTLLRDGISAGVAGTTADLACLDGQRLILVSGSYWRDGSVYRTEAESGVKVVYQLGGSPIWSAWNRDKGTFIVYQKNGDIYRYGASGATRVAGGPAVDNRISRWALETVEDRLGHGYKMAYLPGGMFLSNITYTTGNGWHSHLLSIQYHPDPYGKPSYVFGGKYDNAYRIHKILAMTANETSVKTWNFSYQTNPSTKRSLLKQVQECGAGGQCLAPTDFDWDHGSNAVFSSSMQFQVETGDWNSPLRWWVDMNSDGKTEFCRVEREVTYNSHTRYKRVYSLQCYREGSSGGFVNGARLQGFYSDYSPVSSTPPINLSTTWFDVDRNGYPNFCFRKYKNNVDEIRCYRNSSGGGFYGSWSSTVTPPVAREKINSQYWQDTDGDGTQDYCYAYASGGSKKVKCAKGSYDRTVGLNYQGQWVIPETTVASTDGTWVDLTGDGHSEYCWFTKGASGLARCYKNNNGSLAAPETQWNFTTSNLKAPEEPPYLEPDSAIFKSDFYDFNGNGYQDYCRIFRVGGGGSKQYQARCLINNGKNWVEDLASPVLTIQGDKPRGLSFTDINQDGHLDWCLQDQEALKCQLSQHGSFSGEVKSFALNQAPTDIRGHVWVDVVGDGIPRLCAMNVNSVLCWNSNNPEVPDYLTGVTNGLGLEYRVRYANTNDASAFGYGAEPLLSPQALQATTTSSIPKDPLLRINAAMRVVSHLDTSNGVGGMSQQAYYYEDYGYYHNELGPMGFRYIRVDSENGNKRHETWYEQDGYEHLAGQVSRETTSYKVSGSFKVVRAVQYDWETIIYGGEGFLPVTGAVSVLNGNTTQSLRYAVRLKSSNVSELDLSGDLLSRVQSENTYNNYGDLVEEVVTTTGTGQKFTQTTISNFDNNEADWLLGRQIRSSTTSSATYQGVTAPSGTRTSAWEYYGSGPFMGMLRKEIIEPDQPEYRRVVEYSYNGCTVMVIT